jgi:hypothetical protein
MTDPSGEVANRPILVKRRPALCPPKSGRNIDVIGRRAIVDNKLPRARLDQTGMCMLANCAPAKSRAYA